jgi:TatD DNase family protein
LSIKIFDTHAHLDMPHFDSDREDVIKRAREIGVKLINTVGIDLKSSHMAIELAEKYPGIVASIGMHPLEATKARKEDVDEIALLARNPKEVAVGEMGLDFYHADVSRELQIELLSWELEMAEKVDLPIIIHSRQAEVETRSMVEHWIHSYQRPNSKPRGVLHCFNGDLNTAEWYVAQGFFISLGAYIGYPSSKALREVISEIPADRLVVETDCPFLPPQKYRGKRNEPSYTLITLGVLAEIKRKTLEEMADQTTRNAMLLFGIKLD